jgi:hypothetical protein
MHEGSPTENPNFVTLWLQYKPALDLAVRNETLRRNREETNSSSFFNPFGRVYTTEVKGNSREVCDWSAFVVPRLACFAPLLANSVVFRSR